MACGKKRERVWFLLYLKVGLGRFHACAGGPELEWFEHPCWSLGGMRGGFLIGSIRVGTNNKGGGKAGRL